MEAKDELLYEGDFACGSSNVVDPPSVFSSEAKRDDFPWLVRLSVRCTGSILGKQWIITAAHCLLT